MIKKNKFLVPNVFLVNGYKKTLLIDCQKDNYMNVPNSISYIFDEINNGNYSKLHHVFANYTSELNEYLSFLEDEGYLIEVGGNLSLFKAFPLHFDSYCHIQNSIIYISKKNYAYCIKRVKDFFKYYCNHFFIIVSDDINLDDLCSFLLEFNYSTAKSLHLLFENSKTNILQNEKFQDVLGKIKRVTTIIFLNSDQNSHKFDDLTNVKIIQSKLKKYNKVCGRIANGFVVNHRIFTESQHYNTCLNRKVCIDGEGNIKNCPAMERSFGNIKDITLEEAINKPGFKDLWGIRKDDIDVCKDCEFRYMCTDCRCFIKNPDDIYSQPAKCPYNPYIAKWDGEDGYITVEQWRSENPNWEKKAKRKPLVKKPQPVE